MSDSLLFFMDKKILSHVEVSDQVKIALFTP